MFENFSKLIRCQSGTAIGTAYGQFYASLNVTVTLVAFVTIRRVTTPSSSSTTRTQKKKKEREEKEASKRWRSCRDLPQPFGDRARRGWCGMSDSSPGTPTPTPMPAASWGARGQSDPPPVAAATTTAEAEAEAGRRSAPTRCRRSRIRRRRTPTAASSAGSSARRSTTNDRCRGGAESGKKSECFPQICIKFVGQMNKIQSFSGFLFVDALVFNFRWIKLSTVWNFLFLFSSPFKRKIKLIEANIFHFTKKIDQKFT